MLARFFRSDAMVERLGEAEDHVIESREFFQLTYDHLRDMEGEVLALFRPQEDVWLVLATQTAFSDVVIYNDPN